jgi:hypothetical protein
MGGFLSEGRRRYGVEGWQELSTVVIMGGTASLTSGCVQGDLKALISGEARSAFKDPFVDYISGLRRL